MRKTLVVLLLVMALLAGCSDSGGGKKAGVTEEPDRFEEVEVTTDTGAIRGIVFNEAIVPIPGVLLALSGGKNATSDKDGAFVFNGLDEGDYFISASKLGFKAVQVSAHVTAGVEPPVTKIQLAIDQATQPFVEHLQWTGFLGCGGAAAGLGVNPCAADAILCDLAQVCLLNTANTHVFEFGAGEVPTYAQAEMVWEGSQPLGNVLSLGWFDSGTSDFKGADGTSPLTLPTNKTEIVDAHDENITSLLVRVFPGQQASGLTITLQQKFDVYVAYFYNFEPRKDWTFVLNGPCAPIETCQ